MASTERPDDAELLRVASKLRFEAAVAQASSRLRAAGVGMRLLKGASIAQWLYSDEEPRASLDCDVLVDPHGIDGADDVLTSLGYGRHFDDRSMPGWWREHASPWVRERDGVTIDLHRSLQGVGVGDGVAWEILSRDHDVVVLAGLEVPTLALPARALNLALHAAHHGSGWSRPIRDLERGIAQGDEQLWRDAVALARELDAVDAFAAGLRLTVAGQELAARLELPPPSSVKAALHASSPPPIALGFEQLAQARGVRARLAIVWHKFVPPPDFIRHWDASAKEGRIALLRAYLRRPVWLLRSAPEGFRAWREARQSVSRRGR